MVKETSPSMGGKTKSSSPSSYSASLMATRPQTKKKSAKTNVNSPTEKIASKKIVLTGKTPTRLTRSTSKERKIPRSKLAGQAKHNELIVIEEVAASPKPAKILEKETTSGPGIETVQCVSLEGEGEIASSEVKSKQLADCAELDDFVVPEKVTAGDSICAGLQEEVESSALSGYTKVSQSVQTTEENLPDFGCEVPNRSTYLKLRAYQGKLNVLLLNRATISVERRENIFKIYEEQQEYIEVLLRHLAEREGKLQIIQEILANKLDNLKSKDCEENSGQILTGTKGRDIQETRQEDGTAKSYAMAVQSVSETVLIEPTAAGRLTSEVQTQLENLEGDWKVQRVKRTRKGLAVRCGSATDAIKLKEAVNGLNKELGGQIKTPEPRIQKSKVIILHVQRHITEEQVRGQVKRELRLGNTLLGRDTNSLLKLEKRVSRKMDSHHWTLEAPATLSSAILKQGWVYLGVKRCPVQPFVKVYRCFRCQRYDHLAAECTRTPFCARCGMPHLTEVCPGSNPPYCWPCHRYNSEAPKNLRVINKHHATSPQCPTYRLCHEIQHLEILNGKKVKSSGEHVVIGAAYIRKDRSGHRWVAYNSQKLQKLLNVRERHVGLPSASQAPRKPASPALKVTEESPSSLTASKPSSRSPTLARMAGDGTPIYVWGPLTGANATALGTPAQVAESVTSSPFGRGEGEPKE